VLAIVVISVARRGAGAVSWDFFTKPQALFGQPGGGIANALVGTALLVLLATAMALPAGVLTAIYLTEFAPRRLAVPIQVVIDVLAGLPTIVIGIFVYALLVIGHTQSGYAGAFALAVIMLPLIARATQEVLLLVPSTLREASLALGVRRWRTVLGVILPSSVGGILTGTVLGGRACSRRDCATALHQFDLREQRPDGRDEGPPEHPGADLHVLRAAGSCAAPASVGGRTGADGLRAPCEPGREGAARPQPQKAGPMTGSFTIAPVIDVAQARRDAPPSQREVVFDVQGLTVNYGRLTAISGVDLQIYRNVITAIIGPSGCGKSTFIRCLNRMNDLVPGTRIDGQILYQGADLYASGVDPVEVRRRIGMVFQKANPFPKSIYDNVGWGPRVLGMRKDLDERVEKALRRAALWDEVKDRLKKNALSLSGGQQQRLCIARAIAVEPEVLLLDEPASALDPIATSAIEELMHELKRDYTLVIVTHNMQQAARVADLTAFFSLEVEEDRRSGVLVEYDSTNKIFTNPSDQRTEDYVTGRFG